MVVHEQTSSNWKAKTEDLRTGPHIKTLTQNKQIL